MRQMHTEFPELETAVLTHAEVSFTDISSGYQTAERRTIETLLNSFCREFQVRDGYLTVEHRYEHNALTAYLCVHFLEQQRTIHIEVEMLHALALFHYTGQPYERVHHEKHTLTWLDMARLIQNELELVFKSEPNEAFFEQVRNSIQVLTLIHNQRREDAEVPLKKLNYIQSEQLLLQGHSFHPTPKSREGFTTSDVQRYSPEFKAAFKLHYFEVDRRFVKEASNLGELPSQMPWFQSESPQCVRIPVHPWQACFLLSTPLIQSALRAGWLRDVGIQGGCFQPTSSIRTLYQQGHPFFYKLSLNVRITNCIRKNAYYELESSSLLDAILAHTGKAVAFPHFNIMREPAYITVDHPDLGASQRHFLQDAFGLILRSNFTVLQRAGSEPILAGMLFSRHMGAAGSYVADAILQIASAKRRSYAMIAIDWFRSYVALLIEPVLYYHFVLGITFEPHLQNTLIGLKNGFPEKIYLRDLEGTKLNPRLWSHDRIKNVAQKRALSSRALQSVFYDDDQGWKRIAYCLLVNNLAEAVLHLSRGDYYLETQLWDVINDQLADFATHYDVTQIHDLLNGASLPIKANLTTRFLKAADRHAHYVYVDDHPFKERS